MVEQLLKQLFREVLREELQSLREELRAPAAQPEQIYLSTRQAAKLVGLHPDTLRAMVNAGRIPRREIAGKLRFARSDLDGLLGVCDQRSISDEVADFVARNIRNEVPKRHYPARA